MKIVILSILIFFQLHILHGQRTLFKQKYFTLTEDFNLTHEELEVYKSQGKLEIFNAIKQKTTLTDKLIGTKVGKTIKVNKKYDKAKYKVVAKSNVKHFRVRYIFINKNKFENEEKFQAYLVKVRDLITKTEFKSVAMQYSMDYKKGVGGDSGWFKEGKTHPVFFEEVTKPSILADQVFEFEIPDTNWYYVVKKTHAAMDIQEVLVLELKEE